MMKYVATPKNSNILIPPHMREFFGCDIGFYNHTLGIGASVAVVSHNSTQREKQSTLSRAESVVDFVFSMENAKLKMILEETECPWQVARRGGISADGGREEIPFSSAFSAYC